MNTEEMEAFSIEPGEQIMLDGFVYRVVEIQTTVKTFPICGCFR